MVGRARKLYKVEYPAMYSDTEQVFNCYQRVHQNTLERVTVFLVLLLAAGLFNAKMAAAFGFIWLAGRIIYSIGYYSGIPKNRIVGSFVSLTNNKIKATFLLNFSSARPGPRRGPPADYDLPPGGRVCPVVGHTTGLLTIFLVTGILCNTNRNIMYNYLVLKLTFRTTYHCHIYSFQCFLL